MTAGVRLQRAGKKCLIVSGGLSLHNVSPAEFLSLGGTFMPGDTAVEGEWDGNVLKSIRTRNLGKTPLEAANFILCTGKFFSKGLVSSMDGVYEPLFGCDVDYLKDRVAWVNRDFFEPQPFESFGVVTTPDGCVMRGGIPAANLYAAGEILSGKVDIVKSSLEVCRKLI